MAVGFKDQHKNIMIAFWWWPPIRGTSRCFHSSRFWVSKSWADEERLIAWQENFFMKTWGLAQTTAAHCQVKTKKEKSEESKHVWDLLLTISAKRVENYCFGVLQGKQICVIQDKSYNYYHITLTSCCKPWTIRMDVNCKYWLICKKAGTKMI